MVWAVSLFLLAMLQVHGLFSGLEVPKDQRFSSHIHAAPCSSLFFEPGFYRICSHCSAGWVRRVLGPLKRQYTNRHVAFLPFELAAVVLVVHIFSPRLSFVEVEDGEGGEGSGVQKSLDLKLQGQIDLD